MVVRCRSVEGVEGVGERWAASCWVRETAVEAQDGDEGPASGYGGAEGMVVASEMRRQGTWQGG
jgi:hypothetical protein